MIPEMSTYSGMDWIFVEICQSGQRDTVWDQHRDLYSRWAPPQKIEIITGRLENNEWLMEERKTKETGTGNMNQC